MDPSSARRPARTYQSGKAVKALRIASVLGALLICAWMLWEYRGIADTAATNPDAGGTTGRYGHGPQMLWGSTAMLATILLIAWGSKHPARLNYPFQITEQNAQPVYREGERTLAWVAGALMVLDLGLARGSIGAASAGLEAAGLLLLAAAGAIGIMRIIRAGRPGTQQG
ncbi:hypothetical protein [Glutamicibacter sp.]|uniref:hypothetical protein n=1 Tax=Glutamicibacter sp. TaxID=1931995 RepID=UPI003D6A2993